MIDISKYNYWLKEENMNDNEIVFREMYTRIGHIFHIIQMIEYNISNILAIEDFQKGRNMVLKEDELPDIKQRVEEKFTELLKCTAGQLVYIVKSSSYLNSINADLFAHFVEHRNYLAHRCFKEKLLDNSLSNLESVDKFVDELNDFEVFITDLNEKVSKIFEENKIKPVLVLRTNNGKKVSN